MNIASYRTSEALAFCLRDEAMEGATTTKNPSGHRGSVCLWLCLCPRVTRTHSSLRPRINSFVPQRVPRWSGTTSVPGARVRWTNTPQRGRVSAGPRGARERAGRTEQRRLRPPGRRRAAIANSASHEHPSLHVSDSAAVSFFVRRGSCTRTARAGGYLMACGIFTPWLGMFFCV